MECRLSHHALAVVALCVGAMLGITRHAAADPTMSINTYYSIDPVDGFYGRYTVTNTSPDGICDCDYSMVSFTIPAGTNQGVIPELTVAPDGWMASVDDNNTYFWGNVSIIPPNGGQGVFELYSTLLHVGQGEATAEAFGTAGGRIPFNPVLVDVPAYHPLDRDHDVDVDGVDFTAFDLCFSGPNVPYSGDCDWADLDGDNDVDQSDFGIFQRCFTGHGNGYIEGCETP